MSKEMANQGDTIEWSFPENNQNKKFAGKTFRAKVAIVDRVNREYGVYSEYGQDLIPFDEAKIVKT
jgi:hypothetical protein